MKSVFLAAGIVALTMSGAMAQGSGAAGDIGGAAVRSGSVSTAPTGEPATTTAPKKMKMVKKSKKAASKKM